MYFTHLGSICPASNNFFQQINSCNYTNILFVLNPNANLGEGMGIILPLCWFSLNDSETVKAVTLGFCSIQ